MYWSQVLSREWRCSWSSAGRRCSDYICVVNTFIVYLGVSYCRGFTVTPYDPCSHKWLICSWGCYTAIAVGVLCQANKGASNHEKGGKSQKKTFLTQQIMCHRYILVNIELKEQWLKRWNVVLCVFYVQSFASYLCIISSTWRLFKNQPLTGSALTKPFMLRVPNSQFRDLCGQNIILAIMNNSKDTMLAMNWALKALWTIFILLFAGDFPVFVDILFRSYCKSVLCEIHARSVFIYIYIYNIYIYI